MSISKVGTYAFYNHPNLERVVVSAPVIEANAFQNATKLETADMTSEAAASIGASAFSGCSNLTHLVVRSTARSSLSATSAFNGTKIKLGDGGVYVPADLLDSYKSATNWSTIADNIFPIGEYPKANFDTINDSWSDIIANVDYSTAYAVKDTKTMELTDGTKIKMDLAAIDTDVKSDNSGTAKMTWICHGVPYTSKMHGSNDTTGGWITRNMIYPFLQEVFDKIPQEIKSHIVSVKKTYRTKAPNDETLSSNELIWIPSYKEVGQTNASYVESDGVEYSGLFTSGDTSAAKATRIKCNTSGASADWWLRSAYDLNNFGCIIGDGGYNKNPASYIRGVVFGFCTD